MMKALLIIDRPTDCFKCPCFDNDASQYRCRITGKLYEECDLTTCPLRDLPMLTSYDQAYEMAVKHSNLSLTNTHQSLNRFIDGWQSCIEEIEGK